MRRPSRLLAIAVALALPGGSANFQAAAFETGLAQQLSQFDRNGNGMLEPHERAAMTVQSAPLPLSAFPVICDAQSTSDAAGGAAASASEDAQQPPPQRLAQQARERRDQPAEAQRPNDGPAAEDAEASLANYAPEAPAPPAQPIRIRNAVQLRMLLNERQIEPRSQPFAQAATFGPMVGRARHYPRHYASFTADVGCACSRVSVYFAGR